MVESGFFVSGVFTRPPTHPLARRTPVTLNPRLNYTHVNGHAYMAVAQQPGGNLVNVFSLMAIGGRLLRLLR